MSKHTKGPWFYIRGDEWSHSVVTHHGELPDGLPNYWTVASINKKREPEHEANARLIAAAPDLLDALRLVVRQNSHDMILTGEELRICEAAIAKATGEQV